MLLFIVAWIVVFGECENLTVLIISKVIALAYIIFIFRIKRWME